MVVEFLQIFARIKFFCGSAVFEVHASVAHGTVQVVFYFLIFFFNLNWRTRHRVDFSETKGRERSLQSKVGSTCTLSFVCPGLWPLGHIPLTYICPNVKCWLVSLLQLCHSWLQPPTKKTSLEWCNKRCQPFSLPSSPYRMWVDGVVSDDAPCLFWFCFISSNCPMVLWVHVSTSLCCYDFVVTVLHVVMFDSH